jgi:DNA-binding NarL/FixJ family response regulator
VLLADDHPALLEVIRKLLGSRFDLAGTVDDGEALCDAAQDLRPDVIVTDISMPKLDGIAAADRLREWGCPSRIVFLTIHDSPTLARKALRTGAFGFVVKTSMTRDLLPAIRAALEGRIFVSKEASIS